MHKTSSRKAAMSAMAAAVAIAAVTGGDVGLRSKRRHEGSQEPCKGCGSTRFRWSPAKKAYLCTRCGRFQ